MRSYLVVGVCLSGYFGVLAMLVHGAPAGPIEARTLLPPLFAQVALTTAVWLAMLLARNVSVALGKVSVRYYQTYSSDQPPEWIERPARTFMNLLEVPVLFYVGCLLSVVLASCDRAQLLLAWAFVGIRALHAVVYIGLNHVPTRFAVWVASCITLGVFWVRLAEHVL